MKNKTQAKYVQGKFIDGETVFYVKGEGVYQQVKIIRLVNARFIQGGGCNVTYLVQDLRGCNLNEEIGEVRLISADEMMEQIASYTEHEWVKKDLKE